MERVGLVLALEAKAGAFKVVHRAMRGGMRAKVVVVLLLLEATCTSTAEEPRGCRRGVQQHATATTLRGRTATATDAAAAAQGCLLCCEAQASPPAAAVVAAAVRTAGAGTAGLGAVYMQAACSTHMQVMQACRLAKHRPIS